MKKNLLSTALIALTALFAMPLGVWADINFGSEVTVNSEKTWVFGGLTANTEYKSVTAINSEYYIRAANADDRKINVVSSGVTNLTFADGTTVTENVGYCLSTTGKIYNVNNITASSTAGYTQTTTAPVFAFNAKVAGTVYVKIQGSASDVFRIYFADGSSLITNFFTATGGVDEIAYTSTGEGAFFIFDVTSSYKIYGVRFVPSSASRESISESKTWTFNDVPLIGVGSNVYVGDGLYLRGYTTGKNVSESERTFTIETGSTIIDANSFGGEFDGSISKVAVTHTKIENPTTDTKTAGAISGNKGTPTVAFNTALAGTVYAAMGQANESATTGTARIYFGDGSTAAPSNPSGTSRVTMSSGTTVYYPYLTSTEPGTFMIGAAETTAKIYAVRFIPSVDAPTFSQSGNTITITAGTCRVDGATLTTYYTTNGTEPSSSNNAGSFTGASGEVTLTANTTFKAITVTNTTTIYSAVATSEEFTYTATPTYVLTYSNELTAAGSISATVDDAVVSSGSSVTEGKTVTLTATVNSGYQFVEWTDGSDNRLSTLSEYSFTMNAATTVKAVFKATPTTPEVIETATTWTFDGFTANTSLFPSTSTSNNLYDFNNLYITGHANNNPAVINAETSSVSTAGVTEETVTNYLYLAGAQNSDLKHNRTATTATADAVAFKTGSKAGMVYVAIKGTTTSSETRYVNIYEAIATTDNASNTSANKYQTPTTGSIQAVERYIASNANVFMGTSAGAAKFYAVKFVPETVGTPSISQENNTVTITAGTSNFAGSDGVSVKTYYTTDGTAPTSSSTEYTAAFEITADCTVKAITISSGGNSSSVAELACTYTPTTVNSAVTFEASVSGGGITVMNGETPVTNGAEIASGTTLTVTVAPSDGYVFNSLSVTKTTGSEAIETTQDSSDETKYTFTMPTEAVTITATFNSIFGSDEVVNEETTWLFNGYNTVGQDAATSTSATATNKLYHRVASGRSFAIAEVSEEIVLFNDGTTANVKKIATSNSSSVDGSPNNWKSLTAGELDGTKATGVWAFNASVPGTCYALVNRHGEGNLRIYFGDAQGSDMQGGTGSAAASSTVSGVEEISFTSTKAGVFFISGLTASATRDIYAIRFVPTGTDLTNRKTLTLPIPTGGTVEVKAGTSGSETATDIRTFESGTSVVLTPTATTNYAFDKWTDGDGNAITDGTINEDTKALTLTLTESRTVNAVFTTTISNAVTFTANPEGGTITVNNGTGDIETNTSVAYGTIVTITATPDRYYSLSNIKVTKTNDEETVVDVTNNQFTMPEYPVTITATFVEEEMVSSATTWLFDGYTAGTSVVATNKLYNRSASGRAWAFETLEDANKLTDYSFGGTKINVTTKASNSGANGFNNTDSKPYVKYLTAGFTGSRVIGGSSVSLETEATPFFAFNASVPGTCYALVKSDGTNQVRIFFGKGDGETALTSVNTTSSEVTTISKTSESRGVFFIGGATSNVLREIYAIRFVPTRSITVCENVTSDKATAGEGDLVTLTVNAPTGKQLATLKANNENITTQDTDGNYTFTMPDENVTITATFSDVPTYTVSKSTMTNGDVTIEPTTAAEGETVTLTVSPADGYRLKSGTLKATYNDGSATQELTITDNTFTMPAYAVTVSAEFEEIPAVHGTYDFKTFATENITFAESKSDAQAVPELSNGIMTGNFTLDAEQGTIDSEKLPITLNDVFSLSNANKFKLRKNSKVAQTGLLMEKSSTEYVTINRLSAGDWFVIENDGKVLFKTTNESIKKLGSTETIAANEAVASGTKYIASAATTVELYNNNVDNSYIYSVTISKDEAISDPEISDLSSGKVTITAGQSTTSGTLKTYYTIDGSEPTANSTEYSAAVEIEQTRIVKAVTINTTTNVASNVVTKKIEVSSATPATTWDFTSLGTLSYNETIGVDATYNGGHNTDFQNIVGTDIHAKMSWLNGEGVNSETGVSGAKPFTINDLAVGDKIVLTYTGGTVNVSKGTNGNTVQIGGTETTEAATNYEVPSGEVIEVTALGSDGHNYLMLRPGSSSVKITKIEINPAYHITNGTTDSDITVTIAKVNGESTTKTFDSTFEAGTKVTLKATTTKTGGAFTWIDDDDNTLVPTEDDGDGELTLTLRGNVTVKATYSNAKIWDFSDWETTDEITTVTEKNGLYYRGGADTRKITVAANAAALTWNFPDGTSYSRSKNVGNSLVLKGNSGIDLANDLTPASEADNKSNLTLAFTTPQAGTVYVAYRISSGRKANLYFKSTSDNSYNIVSTDGADDNNNRQGMLFYTAPEAGSFFIGGTGDMNVYLVQFEPTSESIFTLTETANPTDGGSVKKEIKYGDTNSPSYYETPANTFLAGTELRLTPAANVGYGFTKWGDNTTDETKTITMSEDQSVMVNFEEVKHTVTVADAENGTVALKVGDAEVELTNGKAQIGEGATVTIMPTPTLFYGVENITVTKTDDTSISVEVTNGKFTLPDYNVTVTVTFAEENKCYSEKTWTFETTDLSETITTVKYFKDGLYLRGSSGSKAITQVDASVTSVTLNGEAITVSKALKTAATFDAPDAGNNSATAVSPLKATSGTAMLALNTAVKGTLYVAMSPISDESGEARVYFYDGTNEPTAVKAKTAFSPSSEVYTVSYETTVPGIFFVGGTKAVNIYAAKFVPADTSGDIKITKMSESGNIYQLSNGLLTVTIGSEGYVDKIVMADGTEIMKEGSDDNSWGYLSYNTSSSDSRRLFKDGENYPTVNIVTQTSDMVEIVYTNDNNSLAQTWSVGYIMRKGVSGLYTYAKVKNGSTESDLPEARFVWRPDRDNFNYGYVSDDRQGTEAIPSYDRFEGATELQDATYRFSDNTIYTKYDWANFVKDDQVHGAMSNTNGIWVITPSYEWINGGVQKQDLMVHADDGGPVVLQMMQSQHFGAASHTLAANEEKFFGPSLLYLNSGSSKDAMISDAKTMAESEVGAWPYSWFENDDYPQASDRSKVTGTITLSNTDFTTTKIRVILADNSVDDPLVQVGGYQYATDVESTTGSYAFSINNVREGTYALFAYALNGDATGVLKTSRTYTMPTNKGMGTIVWEPKKYGEKLWQIGEADHSTAGFKLSDHARQYGLWEQAPASLTYTVGTSTESDWYYVQPKGSTWTVNFDCDETFTEPLHLTIAVAGASRKPTLVIKMNDHQVYNAQYTSDDPSVYRSATLAGKYGLLEVEIPANNMVTGTNSLTIAANSSSSEVVGLMYDCIKLERPNPKYVVDDVKNWVFGELTTGTVYKAITPVNEEYYLRAGGVVTGTSTATRTFTVTDATDTPTFTFADGSSVSTNTGKYLKANGAYKAGDNPIGATSSAGGNESYSYPMFAFNISESGTVYAKVKGTKNDKFRIYFANGNSITNKEFTATGDIDEITCTASEAGSVFITDVTSAFEIHAVRFVPDSKAVKYELTLGSPEDGTITASVGSTSYAGGTTNEVIPVTEVTLTAVPGTGYQLKGWTDGDGNAVGTLPQSIVNTYTMPTASATVTAEFEALPKLEGLTEKTTWLFDGFKAGTILSDSEAYGFNNGTGTLYVSGHSNGSASAMATVKAGDEVSGNLGSIEVKATNYLALAGEAHSDTYVKSDRAANTFTKDAIAFRASRPGTVYALMQGTYSDSETRTFNIYVNGTVNKTEMPSDNAATVVSQEIADTAATVFIAGSRGDYKVYAVRFVPQEDKKVEVVVTKEDDNNATVTSVDIGSDAAEVVIPATAEDGTPVTKIADDVFTEDNTANVSSIDLSETKVTLDGNRSTNDVLKDIPENTLIYVPETSSVTGTNVVKKTGEGDNATYDCENYEVVDGKETTIPHSFTAANAKLERNFTAGKKCTVCLPYDFEAEGGTFYKFTGISNGKVQMTQQTGLLPKNTPYIFVPEEDATEAAVAENVEVMISGIPETVNDESNFTFSGTYERIKWEAPSGIYGFAAEEKGLATVGQFVRVGNGASIEAYRAFLTYTGEGAISGTNAAPSRRASSLPDVLEIEWIAASGTTVIREMRQSDEHDAPVYNMSGQRVDGSYKGMVIINGKKVIRK